MPELPETRIKTAVVGCGRIGIRHAKILANLPDVELVAMVDVDRARAQEFARAYGGRPYGDLTEAVVAERPELVNICTPSGSHAALALASAAAGVSNLVVEKPMALKLSDADAMIRACDEAGTRLYVVMQNRYNLPITKLREAVDQGRFGKLVLGAIRVRWCRRQDYYNQDAWRGTWAHDGGVFANQASHHVDMLSYMMGPVASLAAMTTTRLVSVEVEDTGVCILKFENGALGVIEATTAARPVDLEGSISILGEHGTVEVGGFAMNEIKVWRFDDPQPEDAEVFERYKTNPPDVYGFGHHEYLKDVVEAIKTGTAPFVDGRKGRVSLELINAIYESVESGQEIHLPLEPRHSRLGRG
ncbi:MAG: Gfo/Idh/MocA family oxidoreductase [Thermoanaerobaculaceae bacterium]|nr:Gfo/Idh/MocA family oxidoreductase [Thermoanaerobaculaceae bacterium]MDI9620758.1 Gfo/Idh/MocA family oxidoreductase [Acidobacteriota bacterium]NLH12647.1 Gfo/Idh/MocA family oxidoreductase [Holophagae bacterium]